VDARPRAGGSGEAGHRGPAGDTLPVDVAVGLLAGLVATRAYGLAQEALARPMPEGVKEREERLRPEPTSRVAARKVAEGLGIQPRRSTARAGRDGGPLRPGPGLGAGLRPAAPPRPDAAARGRLHHRGGHVARRGRDAGAGLGLSPPNRAFPAVTHLRGFLNHLAYGAVVALTAEAAYRLTGTTPGPRRGGTYLSGCGTLLGSGALGRRGVCLALRRR
jgi:hypothetical protein